MPTGSGSAGLAPNITGTFSYTQTTYTTLWTIVHGLNDPTPFIKLYDENNKVIEADTVEIIDANTIQVTFLDAQIGGAHVLSIIGPNGYIWTQNTAETTWTIPHDLGDVYPIIVVFDQNKNIILPNSIQATDANTLVLTFLAAQAGFIKVATLNTAVTGVKTTEYEFSNNTLTTLNINHNLADPMPYVMLYDSNGFVFWADTILAVDANNLQITLLVAQNFIVRLLTYSAPVPGATPISLDYVEQLKYRSIVPFVEDEFPEYIRLLNDGNNNTIPNVLLGFFEAYYGWLEQNGQVQYQINRLDILFDFQYGIDTYFNLFRDTYLSSIPTVITDGTEPVAGVPNPNINKATLIKYIKTFFQSKGTEKSIQFILRLLYDDPTTTITLAPNRLLTNPAVFDQTTSFIRVVYDASTQAVYQNLLGRILYGNVSNAQCLVEGFNIVTIDSTTFLEIEIDDVFGTFLTTELLTTRDSRLATQISVTPYVVAGGYTINTGGAGYQAFQELPVSAIGSGQGFGAEIGTIDNTGKILTVTITDPGINYTTPPTINMSDLGNGTAHITIESTYVFVRPSLFPRYNGTAEDIPIQETQTVFTDYTSYYTNIKSTAESYYSIPDVEDFGTYGINGVNVGGVTLSPASDITFGNQFVFSNTNNGPLSNGIGMGPNAVLGPVTPWTVECRVNPISIGPNPYVLVSRWGDDTVDQSYSLYLDASGHPAIKATQAGGVVINVVSSTTIGVNTDSTVAADWDGTTLRIYNNGVVTGSAAMSSQQAPSATGNFWIGRDDESTTTINPNAPFPANARIDEVRISSVARYAGTNYAPSGVPFANSDPQVLGLYHCDAFDPTIINQTGTVLQTAPIEYTYYITSQIPISQYRDTLKQTVHPAGMLFVGILNVSTEDDVVLNGLELYHYYHPPQYLGPNGFDANYKNPAYASSSFFFEERVRLEFGNDGVSQSNHLNVTVSEFVPTILMELEASFARLGITQQLSEYEPYIIDADPNRDPSTHFGHWTFAEFGKYTNAKSEIHITNSSGQSDV